MSEENETNQGSQNPSAPWYVLLMETLLRVRTLRNQNSILKAENDLLKEISDAQRTAIARFQSADEYTVLAYKTSTEQLKGETGIQ